MKTNFYGWKYKDTVQPDGTIKRTTFIKELGMVVNTYTKPVDNPTNHKDITGVV